MKNEANVLSPWQVLNIFKKANYITCNKSQSGKKIICLWFGDRPVLNKYSGEWGSMGSAKFDDIMIFDNCLADIEWGELKSWTKRIVSRDDNSTVNVVEQINQGSK